MNEEMQYAGRCAWVRPRIVGAAIIHACAADNSVETLCGLGIHEWWIDAFRGGPINCKRCIAILERKEMRTK